MSNSVWSDIDINLTKQNDGDVTKNIEFDAITNSIYNIINTTQGSRRMLQPFASNIKGLLFEPIDAITAELLAEKVLEGIQYWEDRVEVTKFDIKPMYDQNLYNCRITVNIKDSNKTKDISFILSR